MILLFIVGLALSLSSLPSLETGAYYLALGSSLVLLWARSRELALPRGLVLLLLFPLLLFCVTLHGIYDHPLADFGKDLWYFTLPIVYLSFGYLTFERIGRWQRFVQPMLVAGGGIAVFSLVNAVVHRDSLASASSVDAYREVTGCCGGGLGCRRTALDGVWSAGKRCAFSFTSPRRSRFSSPFPARISCC